ncbi:AMP-binding protein [Streptomyces sp. NA02950]|uniref:AMP-binding protein n=1 Tax=Streptomyces sp. NA02950 TaxID=2742137 RepID=UPI001591F0DF|nr:AMP-binding protein [Streptomyces sp. NA02950]QKV96400.1 AMP-binding protein [Streptomyces sp. NA02950]
MRQAILGWLDDPPPTPALVDADADRSWSYAQLADRVRHRATALATGRKALAVCLARPDIDSVTGYLAALAADHAVLLLDGTADPAAVDAIIRAYRPEFVLDGDRTVPLEGAADPVHRDLAVLLCTSGSTGSPKFVRLSTGNLDTNAAQIVSFLGIGPHERAVQSLPLHYSYGLSVLNSHLLAGASVLLTRSSLVRKGFWDTLRHTGCTSFAGVPSAYTILERTGFERRDLPALTTLTQAGGRMAPETVLRFARTMRDRGGRLVVMYGQTEATARIAYLPPDRALDKPDRIGGPVPGGALSLADDGELIYTGPNVMLGYARGRADLARGDDMGGRLPTGDLARVDDEGLFTIVGRKRRVAKLCGQRINLDELESLLAVHATVATLELDEKLVIARAPGAGAATAGDLARIVRERIRIPTRFIRVRDVESIPRTTSGKTDYAHLEDELSADDA